MPDGWYKLSVQLISSFIGLVLLTSIAVGLPSIWLIQTQSENQAWAQIEQGSRATQALLSAWQKEVAGLALLTAERPAIPRLLAQENSAELEAFLTTLQEGTELDLLLICSRLQEPVALVGDQSLSSLCSADQVSGYYVIPYEADSRVWLLAAEQITDQDDELGLVIVGVAL